MPMTEVQPISTRLSDLGEGPHWDVATNSLLYVDAFVGDICRLNPYTKQSECVHFDGVVTFAVPYRSNPENTIVTHKRELRKLHWPTQTSVLLNEVDSDKPNNHFNDGKCDETGRLWGGTRGPGLPNGDIETEKGSLYSFDKKDLKPTPHMNGLNISNGMTWLGRKMFFIDSFVRKIWLFDFDAASGTTGSPTLWLDFNENPTYKDVGYPDGMTNDAEGKLWIACYNGGRVLRVDPETKELLMEVKIPASKTTSCCWGGPQMNELFVTTGFGGLNEFERREQPNAGAVFKVSGLNVPGVPLFTFDQ